MELHLIRIVRRSELPGRPTLTYTATSEPIRAERLKELNELESHAAAFQAPGNAGRHKKDKKAGKEEAAVRSRCSRRVTRLTLRLRRPMP
jgi:hypothetical protein